LKADLRNTKENENKKFMNLMMLAMMMSNQTHAFQPNKVKRLEEQTQSVSEFTPFKILQNLRIPVEGNAAPAQGNNLSRVVTMAMNRQGTLGQNQSSVFTGVM
jgi:hypothetical protein